MSASFTCPCGTKIECGTGSDTFTTAQHLASYSRLVREHQKDCAVYQRTRIGAVR